MSPHRRACVEPIVAGHLHPPSRCLRLAYKRMRPCEDTAPYLAGNCMVPALGGLELFRCEGGGRRRRRIRRPNLIRPSFFRLTGVGGRG